MNNKRVPPSVGEFAVGERAELLARITEQAREIERLEALSVTKVMLDIVPGDGDGYEVYAKSVSDVETKLGALGEENEELQFERDKLRAELAAIKAQEPAGWTVRGPDGRLYLSDYATEDRGEADRWPSTLIEGSTVVRVYAEPVSEAKAQGVVMQATDGGRNPRYEGLFDGETEEHRAFRLNAAPVQQVSVPDGWRVGRGYSPSGYVLHSPSGSMIRVCDSGGGGIETAFALFLKAMLAAPAAPAADAWIPVSERLPDVPDGDEREVIVCVKRAHNGQSYSFSARYLNNFPLHSDSEDEPTFVTGWHDVKEHAEYDGWYSPLIDSSSGDEVTHWMLLPAANSAKGVV